MRDFIITLICGVIIGLLYGPIITKEVIVDIKATKISSELVDALKLTGCITLPLWDQQESEGLQICTYEEIMARGWIYTHEEAKARMENK